MVAAGAPADVIQEVKRQVESLGAREGDEEDFEYFEDNAESIAVFLDLTTSWDWLAPALGNPVRMGLRASEVESAIRGCGVRKKRREQVYQDVRLMERAALEVLRKRVG